MKKIFVVALGVALCFALAASASAIDNDSLESRTTEGLFDRNDAFDLARSPSLLYQVKPLHLFTVGSGYSAGTEHASWSGCDDCAEYESDSFLVGVARELGPGSFAIFYETNHHEDKYTYTYNEFTNREYTTEAGSGTQYYFWGGPPGGPWPTTSPDAATDQWPSFDAQDDEVYNFDSWVMSEEERTEQNFSVAYSWHLTDTLAIGAAYEPEFVDEKETVYLSPSGINISYEPDLTTRAPGGFPFFSGGWAWQSWGPSTLLAGSPATWFFGSGLGDCWLSSSTPVWSGSNSGYSWSSTWYPDVNHTADLTNTYSQRFDGTRDTDETVHPIEVEAHFAPSDTWDFEVGIGYTDIEHKDILSGTYQENRSFVGDDPDGNYYEVYSLLTGYAVGMPPYDSATFTETYSSTFTVGGSLRDQGGQHADSAFRDFRDGNSWSIYLSPTYFMNDMHSFRLDLGWEREDGDFTGGLLGRLDFTDNWTVDINGEETEYDIETRVTGTQTFDGRSSGDYDVTSYYVEPRWYVNFDKVRFAAGLGWYYVEEEWNGVRALNQDTSLAWSNLSPGLYSNDNAAGPLGIFNNDGTAVGTYDGRQDFSGEVTETMWRAPVAVEFDITEKLTARAGAAYVRETIERTQTDSEVVLVDQSWIVYDNDGTTLNSFGPGSQTASATATQSTPYDYEDQGCAVTEKWEDTHDYTTYNLGLGYYFTENLQFDLMFSGQSGWVDSSVLYGSFTIIFP